MRSGDKCPFPLTAVTSASGLSRAHQTMSWCDRSRPLGSRRVCQEACPGPSHLGQAAARSKNLLEIEFYFSAPGRPDKSEGAIRMHPKQ